MTREHKTNKVIDLLYEFYHDGSKKDEIISIVTDAINAFSDDLDEIHKAREGVKQAFEKYHTALGMNDVKMPQEFWDFTLDLYENSFKDSNSEKDLDALLKLFDNLD